MPISLKIHALYCISGLPVEDCCEHSVFLKNKTNCIYHITWSITNSTRHLISVMIAPWAEIFSQIDGFSVICYAEQSLERPCSMASKIDQMWRSCFKSLQTPQVAQLEANHWPFVNRLFYNYNLRFTFACASDWTRPLKYETLFFTVCVYKCNMY